MIKHRDLPVLVFSSSITMHSVRLFCSFLFHDKFSPGPQTITILSATRKYLIKS
jgi:hypothetical protein